MIKSLNNDLFTFRDEIDSKVKVTGQIIYLEKYLNDLYDPVLRRIFITSVARPPEVYIRNNAEEFPQEVYLRNVSEGGAETYVSNSVENAGLFDFIVNIPTTVTFDTNVVRDQVNLYRAAGKEFDIQTF